MYDAKNGLWKAHCQDGPLSIIGKMANRHGLVAGAILRCVRAAGASAQLCRIADGSAAFEPDSRT